MVQRKETEGRFQGRGSRGQRREGGRVCLCGQDKQGSIQRRQGAQSGLGV